MSNDFKVTKSRTSGSVGWLTCLFAAVVATGLSLALGHFARATVPFPLGFDDLRNEALENPAKAAQVEAINLANQKENLQRMLAAMGVGIAAAFGLAIGIKSSGVGRGLLAAVCGGAAVAGLAWVAAPHVVDVAHRLATEDMDPLQKAILIHAASWGILVVGFAIAVGVGTLSVKETGKGLLIGALGAVVGVSVVVLVGATLEQFSRIEIVFVDGKKTRMLWSAVPILTLGLLYAWSAFRTPAIDKIPHL